MGDPRSAELLAFAHDLDRRDADLARQIAAATGVLERVDALRTRAERVRSELDAIPAQIEEAEHASRDARARVSAAQVELDGARTRLEEVSRSRRAGEDARATAERAARRAEVAATDAGASLSRLEERLKQLGGAEAALQAEAEGLAVQAPELARSVAAVPRLSDSGRQEPGRSLAEITDWTARAHAALFVVRGGLEGERERIVLEANGLAAAALGEHGGGLSVALVRRRLEEAAGSHEATGSTG